MIFYGTNPIAWSNDDDQTLGAHISLDQCLDECARSALMALKKDTNFRTTVGASKGHSAARAEIRFRLAFDQPAGQSIWKPKRQPCSRSLIF
jgi:hypothetical protein